MTNSNHRVVAGTGTPAAAEPARVAAAIAGPPILAAAIVAVVDQPAPVELAIVVIGVIAAVVTTTRLVLRPLLVTLEHTRNAALETEMELLDERCDRDFRDRLERALRISEAEPATLRTGLRAVAELVPDAEVSLLLNVPDEPRIGWQVRLTDGALEPARPLSGTPTCSALSDSSTTSTDRSTSLDACAHLHDPEVDVSATCVPLRIDDRMLGSVCIVRAPGEPLEASTLSRVEWAVDRTGVRTAEQRLLSGPLVHGRSDPLTGLPRAGTLKNHLRGLVRSLTPFCVAIVEIDSYDTIETDVEADDALRIVAEALCATLRPDDLVCRLDGARFAAVLSQCSAEQASSALERARESLVLMLAESGDLYVTCSTGITESHLATSLEEILTLATDACGEARSAGGNRVAVSRGVTA